MAAPSDGRTLHGHIVQVELQAFLPVERFADVTDAQLRTFFASAV